MTCCFPSEAAFSRNQIFLIAFRCDHAVQPQRLDGIKIIVALYVPTTQITVSNPQRVKNTVRLLVRNPFLISPSNKK